MGLLAVLATLVVAAAPAVALEPGGGGGADQATFPFTTAAVAPLEVPFVVDEDGPVGLYLRLNTGAVYELSVAGVGTCNGVVWGGGYITGVGLNTWKPEKLWDCGEVEAGEYSMRISALAGAGVMTAYLSGAQWA